ncbi:MAG: helicase C-terminal domain-containing protein [Thermoprotei archaeon]
MEKASKPLWERMYEKSVGWFAYDPTHIQRTMLRVICASFARGVLSVIEAANGCGKTTCIAAASTAAVSESGQKVAVFCSTYTQISRVLSEVYKCVQLGPGNLAVAVLGGRSGLCVSQNDVSPREVCAVRRLRCRCPYEKPDDETGPRARDVSELLDWYRVRGMCAFEGEWLRASEAGLIVAPQAYLLNEHAWNKIGRLVDGHLIIVDECHNLVNRGLSVFSFSLRFHTESAKRVAATISKKKAWPRARVREAFPEPEAVLGDIEAEIDRALEHSPSAFTHSLVKELENIRAILEGEYERLLVHGEVCEGVKGSSPSEVSERLSVFRGGAMLSATPGDLSSYMKIAGSFPLYVERCESPYSQGALKVFVLTDFTTRYAERKKNDALEVASRLRGFLDAKRNLKVAAYMPSYEYMEAVCKAFSSLVGVESDRSQKPWVRAHVGQVMFLFDVQGSSGSEGYEPPEGLDVALVVGLARRHPAETGPEERTPDGDDDVSWAVQKAVQAVGRVVRGPQDVGVGILMDRRFSDPAVIRLMPKWFRMCLAGRMNYRQLLTHLGSEGSVLWPPNQ